MALFLGLSADTLLDGSRACSSDAARGGLVAVCPEGTKRVYPGSGDDSVDCGCRGENSGTEGIRRRSRGGGEGLAVTAGVVFRPYVRADEEACLGFFDLNCPQYFAPHERRDYEQFLDGGPMGYETCRLDGRLVGAFGVTGDESTCCKLSWIVVDPDAQGLGVGSAMMLRALARAGGLGSRQVVIAASHLSAPFFAGFGAVVVSGIVDGWGPGMHRCDMELRL